jgi:hypothetical protein
VVRTQGSQSLALGLTLIAAPQLFPGKKFIDEARFSW